MSDVTFNCPHCQQKIECPEEMAGTTADCPSCQNALEIPNKTNPAGQVLSPIVPAPVAPSATSSITQGSPSPAARFVAAKCPSCGGDLQVPTNRDQVKCMYCGGTVITRQAIQLVSGVNVENFIELAKAAMAANNPKEAYDYYTKVLEHDPTSATAWLGKAEAAGWMSTLYDIRTTEMIAGFDNAIKYSPDSDNRAMREHCADVINRVAMACYSAAAKQFSGYYEPLFEEFDSFVTQCSILIAALESAHRYDPNNTTIIRNIIHLCSNNALQGILDFYGAGGPTRPSRYLNSQTAAFIRGKIDEYASKMSTLDRGYTKPPVKKSSDVCFIATATMGDVNHPAVVELRYFRDVWLANTRGGRKLVNYYYVFGPHVARIIQTSLALRRLSYYVVICPALRISRLILGACHLSPGGRGHYSTNRAHHLGNTE